MSNSKYDTCELFLKNYVFQGFLNSKIDDSYESAISMISVKLRAIRLSIVHSTCILFQKKVLPIISYFNTPYNNHRNLWHSQSAAFVLRVAW